MVSGRRHWRPPGSFGPNVRDGRNYTLLSPDRTQFTTAASKYAGS